MITSPQWYAATSVDERLDRLKADRLQPGLPAGDQGRAQRLLKKWRNQAPFNGGDYFDQRLRMWGLSEAAFEALLAQPLHTIQRHFSQPPDWLQQIDEAYTQHDAAEWLAAHTDLQPAAHFLVIAAPLLQRARAQVEAVVEALASSGQEVPFDPQNVADLLLRPLAGGLMSIISRVMVLEMRLAAMQKQLAGDTPEARFEDFIRRLTEPAFALALLEMYPVMARQLNHYVNQWVEVHLEFLRRLCADQQQLAQVFGQEVESSPGKLTALQTGLSDRHRGGRTVMIATFSSGLKVVYKPKSLAIDSAFQEVLRWLNSHSSGFDFRLLEVLDRGTYGWVEFVAPADCRSPAEVQRFYRRMGGYLALLYTLKAVDFHAENLVAAGEHPMLIDLETLFHNHFADSLAEGANRLAEERAQSSVLEIGLLPQRIWGNQQGVGVDVSGLGAPRKQASPRRTLVWEREGTDEMRAAYHFQTFEMNSTNRPVLNGSEVSLADYTADVRQGFVELYELIGQHREDYLQLLERCFAGVEIRILARPTQLYNMLLTERSHPDHLRDAVVLDCLYDKLWLAVRHNPKLASLIPSEVRDLQAGDIPIFTTRPDSHHLWDSQEQCLADCLPHSGLELAQMRVRHMGPANLQEQLWLIDTTFAVLAPAVPRPLPTPAGSKIAAVKARALAAARAVGNHLLDSHIGVGEDASWLVYSMNAVRGWSASPADFNLYDGLGGISFFLAYLGKVSGEERYSHLARAGLTAMQHQLGRSWGQYEPIGGFEGWGSVIYALVHLGTLWQQPALWHQAEQLAHGLPAHIAADSRLDIIAGSAGCIGALLALHDCRPSPRTLTVARLCGEHLLQTAEQMPAGVGWKNHIAKELPLTGFSHGTAGMAWSLLRLAQATGEERFRQAGLQAIAYERSLFVAPEQNWRDLRLAQRGEASEACGCAMAWCHGAPGIGLGRLLSLPYLDDHTARQEIDIAVQTTLHHGFGTDHPGFGQNFSLCHGDLGNLDLLLEASLRLEEYAYLEPHIYERTEAILDSIQQHGWLCGVPQGLPTPGLMTGIAGIGYELLRLAAPGQVPSVLALQRPLTVAGR